MRVKATLCRVVDLQEIIPADGPALCFRVEVRALGAGAGNDALVYRRESFRLTPSFGGGGSGSADAADHEIFVADDFFRQFSFVAGSEADALELVLAKMDEVFGAVVAPGSSTD